MGDAGHAAYIASLWLAALKAAVLPGQDLGVQDRAAAWEALLEKGSKAFVEKLWNGRYFSLWADGDKRDDCCMTGPDRRTVVCASARAGQFSAPG